VPAVACVAPEQALVAQCAVAQPETAAVNNVASVVLRAACSAIAAQVAATAPAERMAHTPGAAFAQAAEPMLVAALLPLAVAVLREARGPLRAAALDSDGTRGRRPSVALQHSAAPASDLPAIERPLHDRH